MTPSKQFVHLKRQGSALLISMIFIIVFSALAVAMATLSGTNAQIADNQCKADGARTCAESGLQVVRYWISRVSIPGTTPTSQRFAQTANSLIHVLSSSGATNVTASYDGSRITIPPVTLNYTKQQSFSAVITQIDADTLQLDITGVYGPLSRTIRTNYKFGTRAHSVFDFGVASRGPLSLAGNIQLEGVNVSVEASAYIESQNSNLALSIIGNSQIAGDVSIVNPIANVFLQGGQAGIGGETGQAAINNHVFRGVPPTEFPTPNPNHFRHYTTNIIDSTTNTTANATFENVIIVAGTNPTFSGHVTLKGVVFVEAPNVVTFAGTADVIGIVVGDGDLADNSTTNRIIFQGAVNSQPVTNLPNEAKFAGIKDETGTFAIAPGFELSFGGNFHTLNGAIASNGVKFFGNAGGTVNGSIINYSDETMTLTGNSDLYFNRSGTDHVPAGFVPEIVLQYDPSSYSEIVL
jgi:Tfp pilus assembly protein PilX